MALLGYCKARIHTAKKKDIITITELVKASSEALEGSMKEVSLSLLRKILNLRSFKEGLEVSEFLIRDSEMLETLSREEKLFLYRMYTAGLVYNKQHSENIEFYLKEIDKSDYWNINTKDVERMFLNISVSYTELKEYEKAIEVLERADQYRIQLAYNYDLLGNKEKAIEIYKKLLKSCDKKTECFINFNLWGLYESIDKISKGKKYLLKAEEDYLKFPDNEYKVTRSVILAEYHIKEDRMKAYGYIDRALFDYEALGSEDIASKVKAVFISLENGLHDFVKLLEVMVKYKKFDNRLEKLIREGVK